MELPRNTLAPFRGKMDRLKFVKYPKAEPRSQGVGPHKDSTGLFTFLSQDVVGGLQVLNKAGEWIDAQPLPGSLVVNIAQGFEAITGGLCPATAHRVIVRIPYKCTVVHNADKSLRHLPRRHVTAFLTSLLSATI